jgi:hypothetical protein
MSQREGICSQCQLRHPVHPRPRLADDFSSFDEDPPDTEGTVGDWVMYTHDAYGSYCEGSGTMPQVLVSESSGSSLDQNGWDNHYNHLVERGHDPYLRGFPK